MIFLILLMYVSIFQSLDHLTYSYKFGSFLKISEFVEFRDRLHSSHHYTRCSVERMLSELLIPSSHEQAAEVLNFFLLKDFKHLHNLYLIFCGFID